MSFIIIRVFERWQDATSMELFFVRISTYINGASAVELPLAAFDRPDVFGLPHLKTINLRRKWFRLQR